MPPGPKRSRLCGHRADLTANLETTHQRACRQMWREEIPGAWFYPFHQPGRDAMRRRRIAQVSPAGVVAKVSSCVAYYPFSVNQWNEDLREEFRQ
jgi:hypothetical protein